MRTGLFLKCRSERLTWLLLNPLVLRSLRYALFRLSFVIRFDEILKCLQAIDRMVKVSKIIRIYTLHIREKLLPLIFEMVWVFQCIPP